MTLRAIILGCGSSMGTPRLDGYWGQCDPNEPKNRRSRCSLMIQKRNDDGKITNVLIDTSPDLRRQILDVGVTRIDGVAYTHDHADQTHGIDDLRGLAIRNQSRIAVYMDDSTRKTLERRFSYCFTRPPQSDYPPILDPHPIAPHRPVAIEGEGGEIVLTPFRQHHGKVDSLGFRFGASARDGDMIGGCAYCSDVVAFPDDSLPMLRNLDLLIVDALRDRPHPSHAHLDLALEWIATYRPKRAVLTNLHVDLDYNRLVAELPDGVEPAFDGMSLDLPA